MRTHFLKLALAFILGAVVSVVALSYTLPYVVGDSPHSTESLFIYGTLQNELIRFYACRCFVQETPATLPEYKQVGLNVVTSPSSTVSGSIIQVTPQQLQFIDGYENTPDDYTRSKVTIKNKSHYVYIKN